MIRRNHIDNGCKIEREGLRSRARQAPELPPPCRYPRRPSPELADENMRVTSNNKKYYQYKEERESKAKPVQEFREEGRTPTPLADRTQNTDLRGENQLRRDYAYDLEDTLKIDYNSISLKTQPEQKRTAQISHLRPDSSEAANPRQAYNASKPGLDRSAPLSPSRSRPAFQSSHKDARSAASKGFVPLFEETTLALKRRELEQSRTRRQSEMGRIYEPSSKKTVKTDYESIREGPMRDHPRKQSIADCSMNKYISSNSTDYNYSSTISYSSGQNYSTAHNYPSKSAVPAEAPCSNEATLPKAPTLPASYHQEEVSQKLRMISDFNDQINERIKNIIGCFEGLKNKL